MESVPLEMDDIFADHEEEADNFPAPLPDLPEELEPLNTSQDDVNPSQDTENAEVLARLKGLSKGAARKTVRRQIPKLDGARLTGDRGIPVLPLVFKDVTFKGKGHEAEDLKLIMGKLEHWAHRLFPKMPFDEVLERIERLGCKKDVQTCVKKMRLDMPLLDSDFVTGGDDEEPADTNNTNTTLPDIPESTMELDQDAEEAFDEMMHRGNEQETNRDAQVIESSQNSPQTPKPTTSAATTLSVTPRLLGTPLNTGGSTPSSVLTPEQMERIERNKKLAMQKRNARLHQTTELTKSPSQPTPSKPKTPVKDQASNNADDAVRSSDVVSNKTTSISHSPTSQEEISGDKKTREQGSSSNINSGREDTENNVQVMPAAVLQQETDSTVSENLQDDASKSDDEQTAEETGEDEIQVSTGDQKIVEPTINHQEVILESCPKKVCPETEFYEETIDTKDNKDTAIEDSQDRTRTKDQMESVTQNENSGMTIDDDHKDLQQGVENQDQISVPEGQKDLTSVEEGQEVGQRDISVNQNDTEECSEQHSKICGESQKTSDAEQMAEDQQTVDELLKDFDDDL